MVVTAGSAVMDQAVHPVRSAAAGAAGILATAGVQWRLIPFDREGWDAEFPENTVQTPFGPVEVRPECIQTPDVGVSLIGLIRPVLEEPSYIVRSGEGAAATVAFHRAVLGPMGEVRGYGVVELSGEVVRVYVSELPSALVADGVLPPAAHDVVLTAEPDDEGEAVFKALSCQLGPWSTRTTLDHSVVHALVVCNSALAFHLLDAPIDLLKADHGPIPPDARWITVHPNGPGSKGQPVLVVPAGEGGSMRVIGGAGGKLNMLKLRGVKDESSYRLEASQRQAEKRKARKDQIASDKALGLHEAKEKARKELFEQTRSARKKFVKTVAEALGWDQSALELDTSELTPEAAKKAQRRHEAELLKKARAAVDLQRRALVADRERQKAAGLQTVPLTAGPEQLGVEDLAPGKVPDGSGISVSFGKMAEAHGLTDDKVNAVEAQVAAGQGKPVDPEKAHNKEKIKAALEAEMAKLEKPADLLASIVDAQKAVDLVKQLKALTAMERQAAKARAEVDTSTVEPKAYVLATSAPSDAEIDKLVEEQVATRQAAAFLAGAAQTGTEADLRSHVSAGAYNAINALQQAVGGAALVDRAVVDVLGVAGAAQVLAGRLHASYGADAAHIAAGLAEYHVAEAPKQQAEALEHAKELQDVAAAIELGEGHTAHDLVTAAALNQKRLDHLGEARKVLGQALGEQEARASLIAALESPPKSSLDVSLGHASVESAVQQLYALGLTTDEFSIDKAGGNTFAKINAVGLDRLAAQVDSDNLARVERNLAIMKGAEDEEDWLPAGFARRPDLGLDLKAGVAPRMAVQFDGSAGDLAGELRRYVGSRTADGDPPADVLADIQSASFFQKVGQARAEEYGKALDAVVPTKKADGGLNRVEDLSPVFEGYADDFVAGMGGTRSTLNRQKFEPDAIAQEALHRALSDEPAGKLAYKQVGDLSLSERGQLRDWFFANVAKESPEQKELRQAAEKIAAQEPEKETTDMFGSMAPNPMWADWKAEHDEAQAKANNAGLDWSRYCKMLGGPAKAIETVQDLVRSSVSEKFAEHHNRLRPHKPLAIGTTVVRNNLRHLGAVDPKEREKRIAQERALIDQLRNRVKGKYAGGSVAEKIDQHKSYEAAFGQAQMGFFSSDELGGGEEGPKPLGAGERRTIGHAAESMIGKMMGVVGEQFKPGQPVKLFKPSMSGPDGVKRQRAIKLVEANKRVALGAGVGSGKTAMMLGAFSELHAKGHAKKGVFVVPSIVQGQFGAEALRFLEPGKFKWHAEPGASYEDRLASYKDPGNHFTVVTHQSFRDDLLRMAVDAGKADNPEAAAAALDTMDAKGRQAWMKAVLEHHGVSPDYVAVDEGHGLLDREGKADSRMSQTIGAVSANSPYYVHASADPVKNDASEAHSLLQKMDPERYADRDAFLRRYGGDTVAAKEGLQRELARHLYTFAVNPDVDVDKKQLKVPVSEAQQGALDTLESHCAALRIAAMEGKADVDAAKAVSPHLFEGVDPSAHEAIAHKVAKSVGIIKQSAIRRILDNHPSSGKLDELAKQAAARKGKQGVVFAHSLDAVEAIASRLEKDGHRVIRLTGKDSSAEKAAKLRKYRPDVGDPEADIVVASDAGATGANMQSGAWLAQYDTPDTAMTHAQRNGRIARIGQTNDVELLDLISDHPSEQRNRDRLARKYGLRDMLTSPLDGIDDSGLAWYLKQAGVGQSAAQAALL